MSRMALMPIWHLIAQSSQIYLDRKIDDMPPDEQVSLENYILRRLYGAYTLAGKVPTVGNENSPECRELERVLRKNAGSEEMKDLVDRIIKGYRELKKREVEKLSIYPSAHPPPPWVKRKKKKEAVPVYA